MSELSHQEKHEQTDKLLEKLDIRGGLRRNLFYLYPDTFRALHAVLDAAEEFDWLIQMHTVQAMWDDKSGGVVTIILNEDPFHNAQLILQEIIDDYWAACLCFQNGFTKQAQSILRSTLELIAQLYYLKNLSKSGSLAADAWAVGKRGVEKFTDKVAVIKKMSVLKGSNFGSRLDSLYNRLCTSAHSRKDRLIAMNLPRAERAKDMPSFEPLEILYTLTVFCAVLDLEVRMLQRYFDEEPKTTWIDQIRGILINMLNELNKMRTYIQNSEKGYIIHREYIALSSNKRILYSVNLNKKLEFPGRQKPRLSRSETDEFQDKIRTRFIRDMK